MEIKEGAFAGCKNLKEITIPATVTRIAADAFAGCESLETVVLNEGLVEIKAGAFQGCAGLTEVIIPTTVTHIEMGAFAGCEELVIKVACSADDLPDGWAEGCFGDAEIEWDFILEDETDESQDTDGGE